MNLKVKLLLTLMNGLRPGAKAAQKDLQGVAGAAKSLDKVKAGDKLARDIKKIGELSRIDYSPTVGLTLGATTPAGDVLQSFVLEFILTLILMFVILSVSTGAKEKGVLAGVAVGSVVALEALFAGPISGASMNPARSLAPALVSLRFDSLWIYLVAPILGACASVFACRCVQEPGCCRETTREMCS